MRRGARAPQPERNTVGESVLFLQRPC